MKHKRQHYVPSSYLKAWCDPETPTGHTPYIWRFSKNGEHKSKKAPKKIFYEKDLYTVHGNDGQRDLHLEYNLSRVEHEFYKLRKNKLSKRKPLTSEEHLLLCTFTAAMYGRTKKHKEHWGSQWKQVLDLGEKIKTAFEEASPKARKQMVSALNTPHSDERESLTMEDVRELAKNPIPSTLSNTVTYVAPILFRMPSMIIDTDSKERFITSDSPCVWFDPASYQFPRPHGAGGLISPTIEITLPISPNQLIIFGKKLIGWAIYVPFHDTTIIDNLNKRTRLASHEYFVFNEAETNSAWF